MFLPNITSEKLKAKSEKFFGIKKTTLFNILSLVITIFLLAFGLPLATDVIAQSCTPSCSSGYFCSLGIECCRCVNGNGPGQVGPVTCCAPPGPGSGSCRTYDVLGCLPDSGPEPPPSTPPPTPTPGPPGPPVPIPPSTQGEPRPRPVPFPCDEVNPKFPFLLDQEHHSLRPYQASPCNQEVTETALFCGNDLVLTDTLSVIKQFFLRVVPIPRWGSSYSYEGNPIGPACFTDANCAIGSSCVNGVCSPPSCRDNGDGTETCLFSIDRLKQIAVDLSRADLPIMGYTEPSKGNESRLKKVVNSNVQPDPETMLHPEKVNEYVSWYLNGVNERAEYPFLDVEKNCIGETTQIPGVCKPTIPVVGTCMNSLIPPIPMLGAVSDGASNCGGGIVQCCVNPLAKPLEPGDILDRDKLINYSGPIKKLLSQSSQFRIRLDEVDDAVASRKNDAGIRHDQVAGCTYDILGIGDLIGPCYHENLLGFIKTDLLLDVFNVRERRRLSDWEPRDMRPPLEEDFQNQTFIDYLIRLKEWRGNFCFDFTVPDIVPIIGGKTFFLCGDSPLRPNFWSNLFNYIPFSSTENRIGEVEITGVSVQPAQPNAIVTNVQVLNQEPAQLFFSHMQESAELADVLQGTYVPRDEPRIGQIADVAPAVAPFCDLTQIRSNPGDDLFAGEIRADVSYTANISCTYVAEGSGLAGDPNNGNLCRHFTGADCTSAVPDTYECAENYGRFDCASGEQCARDCSPVATGYTCDIAFFEALCVPDNFSCTTEVVVGPGLPPLCPSGRRCGQGCTRDNDSLPSPLEQQCTVPFNISLPTITETPKADEIWARLVAGASSVFKRIFPKIGPDAPIASILDIPAATQVSYSGNVTVVAGAPGSQRPGAAAEIYFPHIGGVHEYFLQCIQTALRPQGFAEVCESGAATPGTFSQCGNTMADVDTAISQAASKYSVPSSLLRAIFEIEGIDFIANPTNYVCTENVASAAGVMQITKSTYNIVTCENERLANDLGTCDTLDPSKLSRCDIFDAFELAARTLLWKAGRWLYGPGNCSQTGPFPTDKQSIYNAACNYYGSFAPDSLTINYASGIPAPQRRQNGDMNYCDIVCYKMGLCPPYP